MGWYPRRYGYGGGCCLSRMVSSVVALIFVLIFLFSLVGNIFSGNGSFTYVEYDEEVFQDYTNGQYQKEFGSSSAYEDNILLVFLTSEECYDYYYIAWVGDHIVTDINFMLGNEYTELGEAMSQCINASSYKYSLDSNLAQVFETLTEQIGALGLESSFDCDEEHIQVQSHLTNYTDLPMTEETVDEALAAFTDATGIPVVVVVEDMEEVFGTPVQIGGTGASRVPVLMVVCLVVIAVILIVIIVKRRREENDDSDYHNSRYRDFDN